MEFDFTKYNETKNLIQIELKNKEQYYLDLFNIEESWTGRVDAQISNTFFQESVQLIINAIVLFEKGYFDCAFYSLRQSIEVSTTIIFLIDSSNPDRKEVLAKWKSQSRFPMYSEMLKLLEEKGNFFKDIKQKMDSYFLELTIVKKKLNKYVHKQGFSTFYLGRNSIHNKNRNNQTFVENFEYFLIKSIGAVAVFRLVIDPLPILLRDSEIFRRTGDLMTIPYSVDFIKHYIGENHIEDYKKTDLYLDHYNVIIKEEPMLESVVDLVKYQFVDRSRIVEILTQQHLLSLHDYVCVALYQFSDKISKIYCMGGIQSYFSNIKTNRKSQSWSTQSFNDIKSADIKFNRPYDEAFLSYVKYYNEDFVIEHNFKFNPKEIDNLKQISTIHNKHYSQLPLTNT